ncbi:MAG: 1,4-alpha-glucan branching protein GlgB [Bacillota bacterium]
MELFIKEQEIRQFNEGKNFHSHLKLGAHRVKMNRIWGVHFALWAPNAISVRVVGDFNSWQGREHEMVAEEGIWCLFVPYLEEGELYKYEILTAGGEKFLKADPYAFYSELRPQTASVVYSLEGYPWGDDLWMGKRDKACLKDKPLLIYEVSLASWKRTAAGDFYTYRELARELIPYVLEMGFTHLELMPLMEHPFDGSWGYQITGYYSPTSRFGSPHDLMYFVDSCHQAGLGVILDWVPGHFCKDAHGLGRFDGERLFEGEEHLEWGTYEFNFAKPQVWSFLISNAVFWLEQFHFDGLRVDGVTSMLYLDFGKDGTPWQVNIHGGRENLDAIAFLKTLNETIASLCPEVLMIAEESSPWPAVTKSSAVGGLGFDYKWNMGWMNDTLKYFETDFEKRREKHPLLTFSLYYAFAESFILPLSHDEVVHGKRSLIEKMPGDYWQKFAGLKTLYSYQLWHPGKKLLFMGAEFAQFIEWRFYEGLEWFLLDYQAHSDFHNFVKQANLLYRQERCLWQNDESWEGFQWLDVHNHQQSVLAFLRRDKKGQFVICLLNLTPTYYPEYRVGVPASGKYMEIFNTDQLEFGGSGQLNMDVLEPEGIAYHGQDFSLKIKLPPLAGVLIKPLIE